MKLNLLIGTIACLFITLSNVNAQEYNISDIQENFTKIAVRYRDSISTANNDLQVRLLFKKRAKEFNELNFDGQVSNWIGTVTRISAVNDDIYLDIEIAPKIIFSFSANIENPLAEKLAELNKGQKVLFSGNLIPKPEEAGFCEKSITTRGSIEEPEFKFNLTSIKSL